MGVHNHASLRGSDGGGNRNPASVEGSVSADERIGPNLGGFILISATGSVHT